MGNGLNVRRRFGILFAILSCFWGGQLAGSTAVGTQEENPGAAAVRTLTGNERAVLVPLQRAVTAGNNDQARELLAAARGAITSSGGRFLIGQFGLTLGSAVRDRNMQARGVDDLIASDLARGRLLRDLLMNQANFARIAGDDGKAEAALQRALLENPDDVDILIFMGELKYDTEPAAAVRFYRRALDERRATGQAIPEAWFRRALAAAYFGRNVSQAKRIGEELRAAYPGPETDRVMDEVEQALARFSSGSSPTSITSADAAVGDALATTDNLVRPGAAGPRVALVVGISTYGALGNLDNPGNDARGLAVRLRSLGFDVDLVLDPDQRALRQAISRLGARMSSAGRGATGLFFYAGHGIQARGENYLIPAQAVISREADLALEAVPASAVLLQMQEAGAATNIIILDACRNMPLTRSFRDGTRGLAPMDAPNGSFIAYSTAPGSVAADGTGTNSPFAAALMRELVRPGQPIEVLFRNVRRSVLQQTEGEQTPWDASSLIDDFYFVPIAGAS